MKTPTPTWEEAITNIFDRLLNRGFEPNDEDVAEAKSALTQLFKDLVAEAKPDFDEVDDYNRTFLEAMFKVFEQNLLKLLENK